MATKDWTTPTTAEVVLQAEFNGVADGAVVVQTGVMSRATGGPRYAKVELVTNFGSPTGLTNGTSCVDVFALATLDGTNFPTVVAANMPSNSLVCNLRIAAQSGPQRDVAWVELPAGDIKWAAQVRTGGAAMPTGGASQLRVSVFDEEMS